MQNAMDVLPVDIQPQLRQPRRKAAGTHEGKDFSEAIGNATDKAGKKPDNYTIAEEKAHIKPEGNKCITEDETQPKENISENDAGEITAEQIAACGFVNMQQMVAGLIIGNTKENETTETIGQDLQQPISELPQQQQQTVDVLEGIQTTDIESGDTARPQAAQPAEKAEYAEAWMPTDSSEAKPQETTQPMAEAPVNMEREIESRLEEYLRPLENTNPTEWEHIDNDLPIAETIQTDTNDIEIHVKDTKDDQRSIDDIQGGQTAESIEQPETPENTADDMDEHDANDGNNANGAYRQEPVMAAANNGAQPPRTGVEQQNQRVEDTIFNKMVQNIATNAQQGKREFSINLRPDFMGDMNIELVLTEAGLSAKIKAADPQVNSLISQQLFKLEQSLKEQGIDVVNLEVSVFDTGEFGKEDFSRQNSNQGETDGKAGRIGRVKAVAREAIMAAGMETLSERQTVETLGMGSSVEYKA